MKRCINQNSINPENRRRITIRKQSMLRPILEKALVPLSNPVWRMSSSKRSWPVSQNIGQLAIDKPSEEMCSKSWESISAVEESKHGKVSIIHPLSSQFARVALCVIEACRKANLEPETAWKVLLASEKRAPAVRGEEAAVHDEAINLNEATLTSICDHIEQTHHVYLRGQFPLIQQLLQQTSRAHGSNHPEIVEVEAIMKKVKYLCKSFVLRAHNGSCSLCCMILPVLD